MDQSLQDEETQLIFRKHRNSRGLTKHKSNHRQDQATRKYPQPKKTDRHSKTRKIKKTIQKRSREEEHALETSLSRNSCQKDPLNQDAICAKPIRTKNKRVIRQ